MNQLGLVILFVIFVASGYLIIEYTKTEAQKEKEAAEAKLIAANKAINDAIDDENLKIQNAKKTADEAEEARLNAENASNMANQTENKELSDEAIAANLLANEKKLKAAAAEVEAALAVEETARKAKEAKAAAELKEIADAKLAIETARLAVEAKALEVENEKIKKWKPLFTRSQPGVFNNKPDPAPWGNQLKSPGACGEWCSKDNRCKGFVVNSAGTRCWWKRYGPILSDPKHPEYHKDYLNPLYTSYIKNKGYRV
jgi:hypothetical protein